MRLHPGRLDRRVRPLGLSPAEAVRLAQQGPVALRRRGLPADAADEAPDAAARDAAASDPGPDERPEPGTGPDPAR